MQLNNIDIKEEAKWIREDIKSTDLDDIIKETLLVLPDEQLVQIIKEVEERMTDLMSQHNPASIEDDLDVNKIIEMFQI